MKIIIYIALVLGGLSIGCRNTQGTLKLKGKVIDMYTKSPIPNRDIIVQGLGIKSKGFEQIDAGNFCTDSSGYFTYSLQKIKNANSYNFCFVGDSNYSFKLERVALTFLERNSKNLSFSLSKLADLTIQIHRKSKTPVCDTLFLSWKSNGVDGGIIYPYKIYNHGLTTASELKWIGGNVISTIKTRAFAEQRTTVRWVLFRNGKAKEIIDTITCKRDLANNVYFEY